jgi:hypothetical protein
MASPRMPTEGARMTKERPEQDGVQWRHWEYPPLVSPLEGEMSRSDRGGYRSGSGACGLTPLCPVGHLPREGGRLGSAKAAGFVDDVRASLPATPPVPRNIPPISSTPFTPVPYLPHSRCRMDRKRAGPGGRKALLAVPERAAGRKGRRLPAWLRRRTGSPSQGERVKPATGTTSGRSSASCGRRPDSGPGLWRSLPRPARRVRCFIRGAAPVHQREGARLRAGNRAKPFRRRSLSGADGPGSPRMPLASGAGFCGMRPQAGKAKRQLPVGCGHHPAIIGPRTGCATPCMPL